MNGIDHLVLPVTTLALARSRLTSLGFTVAPDARHPFGTGNCCVFFEDRSYLEPIAIQDRYAADQAAAEGQFFVKRIKRFTERHGEGFAMVALKSDDAEADQAAFAKAGFDAGGTFRFKRNATLPDGSEREIGVVLAYADASVAPDATLIACQHLAPDVLFRTEYLEHPNTVVGVKGVVAVAEEPQAFRPLVEAIRRDGDSGSAGEDEVGCNGIAILTPAAFRERYGVDAPDPRRGMRFAAIELVARSFDRVAAYAGEAARRHENRLVILPSAGLGAVVSFEAAEHG